jgi:leader peptidase (prepilin peptidase)/N-methyltransferase
VNLLFSEWPDIAPAFKARWVAPAWLMAVLWTHFIYPHTLISALWGPLLALFLILLTEVDQRTFTLPNLLTLPMALAGILAAGTQDHLMNALLGLVLGFGVFTVIQLLSLKLLRRDGLGPGDVKLYAAVGCWVGASGLPLVALVASLVALGWIAALRLPRRKRVPFGPFLAVGCWVTYLYQYDMWAALGYIHY